MADTGRSTRSVAEALYTIASTNPTGRTTKTVAEALFTVASATIQARTSRLAVEVLYGAQVAIEESPSNTLSFSGVATGISTSQSVSNTLSLTSQVDRADNPGNSMFLVSQVAVEVVSTQVASNTLSLTDSVFQVSTQDYVFEHPVGLIHSVEFKHVLPTEAVSNTISFTDASDGGHGAESLLGLTQVASGVIFFLTAEVSNSLSLSDVASAETTLNVSASNRLLFNDFPVAAGEFDLTLTSQLNFTQHVIASFCKNELILSAPYGAIKTAVTLPNPLLQDGQNLVDNIDIDWAEDGTLFTYVQRLKEQRLDYTFRLAREKSIELQNFLDFYNTDDMRLCNFKGEIWKVKLITNPIQFVAIARGSPVGPTVDVSLTFEGELING